MFENRFTAKTAVVTGGASGIGKAIVERLAREGAHVAIVDRDQKALDAVAKQFASFGVEAHRVDIVDEPAVAAAMNAFVGRRGRLRGRPLRSDRGPHGDPDHRGEPR